MKTNYLTALVLGTMLSGAASAATLTVNGTTTAGPTWARPVANGNVAPTPPVSGVGTAVRYQATQFNVSTSGSYVFQSTATNWDNYSFLYVNSFNPSAPFTNVLIGNDDNTTIGLSGFTTNLTAGLNYFFVETGFENTDFGAYSLQITGPGNITAGAVAGVPEPATWAMMTLGFGAMGFAMRRKAKVNTRIRFA